MKFCAVAIGRMLFDLERLLRVPTRYAGADSTEIYSGQAYAVSEVATARCFGVVSPVRSGFVGGDVVPIVCVRRQCGHCAIWSTAARALCGGQSTSLCRPALLSVNSRSRGQSARTNERECGHWYGMADVFLVRKTPLRIQSAPQERVSTTLAMAFIVTRSRNSFLRGSGQARPLGARATRAARSAA
jgi:hypothetical protein